jgi:branched-chain amino acid transport system permease protein
VNQLLVVLLSGVASGAVYGLMGLGLVIIYRATDVVNFALASIATAGIYFALTLYNSHLPLTVAVLVAAVAAALGAVLARELLIRPLGPGQLFPALVVTMGLAQIVESVIGSVWGQEPRPFPPLLGGETHLGDAGIRNQAFLAIAVAAVAMTAVAYLFRRTTLGAAMRAVAESADTAAMLGIKPQRVARVAWALGLALAVLAAALYAPSVGLVPVALTAPLFRAFAGIFLGGLTSMYGAVVGGLIIGLLDNLAATYVSASFRDTFVFSVTVLMLLVRPQGLFGERSFQRV